MNSETIVMCVVALILGMLLANMLKNICGCKNIVEGNRRRRRRRRWAARTPLIVFHNETNLHPGDLSFFFAENREEINKNVHNFIKNNYDLLKIKTYKLLESDGEFDNLIKSLKFPLNNEDYMKIVNYKPIKSTYEELMNLQDIFENYHLKSNSNIEGCFGVCIAGGIIFAGCLLVLDAATAYRDPCMFGSTMREDGVTPCHPTDETSAELNV